jgi:hypothetical protein
LGIATGQNIFRLPEPPQWLLAFWKEIDDKTFGKGFDCFTEDATCNLGVADWHGREQIRENLRVFIDTGFTARHDVVEYWDGGLLKVFPRSWFAGRAARVPPRWAMFKGAGFLLFAT